MGRTFLRILEGFLENDVLHKIFNMTNINDGHNKAIVKNERSPSQNPCKTTDVTVNHSTNVLRPANASQIRLCIKQL